ncbi:uncharacterized protein PITG_02120 [Phytophthora infestans T30-4]|uniref:RNase H type-1 domain-containing protein n=1 Tax=Phytophthora infestans (strain T30-4) TaxID=403677 RepID=D0MVJ1_PHYIT|nr:uncharacterized protein PITG_02120 [Phytophthora infestans T30-4]EEY63654.1 conserved hypothetical protein [Phytophthora infestans T30-4]|eukprot:XP_002907090.1 conserved hypothetical protein [Phytophthora infestans T30-4]
MTANPPTSLTMDSSLRNQVVRLECPSELEEGEWDGPIYARLLEPRHIKPGHPSVFVVDDSSRRPGWLCKLIFYGSAYDGNMTGLGSLEALATDPVVIPYSRLTRPDTGLSMELKDRPLLLLYRFVRFNACYLQCDRRSYREVPLDSFLVGQVVSYFPTHGRTFTTPAGAALQPACDHMCVVALRSRADAPTLHVVVPSATVWQQQISRDEFVVGWCHGVAATAQPTRRLSRFRSRWIELVIPTDTDCDIGKLLMETFVPAGSDSTMDLASENLRIISEYGRIIDVNLIDYARRYVGPARPSTRMWRMTQSPRRTSSLSAYLVARHWTAGNRILSDTKTVAEAVPSTPSVVATTNSAMPENVFAAIAELARTTQEALTQQAAAQQSFQEQLLRRLSPSTGTDSRDHQHGAAVPPAAGAPSGSLPNDHRGRNSQKRRAHRGRSSSPPPRPRHTRERSRSRSRDRPRHSGRIRSRDREGAGHGGQQLLHRPLQQQHDAATDARAYGRWDDASYGHSRPSEVIHRDDRYDHYLGNSHDHGASGPYDHSHRHSNYGYGSPRTASGGYTSGTPALGQFGFGPGTDYRHSGGGFHPRGSGRQALTLELAGTTGFRPSPAELRAHRTARVGPRPNDRVSTILHEETRRGQYRVTKVTAKMVFAVDFGTRPIDHFLPPSAHGNGGRTVVHDSSTWTSGDSVPGGLITSMDDLRATLQCIREVATEWYPRDIVDVFAAVCADATSRVLNNAPTGLVHAMINLYSHVFSRLFIAISQNADPASLVDQARSVMASDSPDYLRLVRQVIDHGLISSWAQSQRSSSHRSNTTAYGPSTRPSAHSGSHRESRQTRQQVSPVPEAILQQIPKRNNKTVCLKVQTQRGCEFWSCKYAHDLEQLPEEVVTYATGKYGPLASGHPNLSAWRLGGGEQVVSTAHNTTLTPAYVFRPPLTIPFQPISDVGRASSEPSVPGTFTGVSVVSPNYGDTITLSIDGGARSLTHVSAYAWCAWSKPGKPLWWSASSVVPGGTNNVMEARALLSGLHWLRQHCHQQPVQIIGDSAIVIDMASARTRVHSATLAPLIHDIRLYINQLRLVRIRAVPRTFNVAADALCNWIMDQTETQSLTRSTLDTRCPLTELQWSDPLVKGCPPVAPIDLRTYDRLQWQSRWSLVLLDYERVRHIITNRFLLRHIGVPIRSHLSDVPRSTVDMLARTDTSRRHVGVPNRSHLSEDSRSTVDTLASSDNPRRHVGVPNRSHLSDDSRSTVDTQARTERSPFDNDIRRECVVRGIKRCVPPDVLRKFQAVASTHRLSFPLNRIFRNPTGDRLTLPFEDIRFLSAVVQLPHMGIEGTLRVFRGQTSRDDRPNKALRPRLFRQHLASYEELELLCSIAEHGVVPHWRHSVARAGVRPVPHNYPSAITGATVVTHRLRKDYYAGRCIIATMAALTAEPGFHSSAFALVPKKDVPLSEDGRIIHDLSAPQGLSVNDITDTSLTPDARWDQFSCIAIRIVELRTRYPGCRIYALVADIAEAFHHVPVHAHHSSAFGGTFPRSHIGIVSGMVVFGWTASPGFFAIMGKATRHYQRTGASYVSGYPEPFWVFNG